MMRYWRGFVLALATGLAAAGPAWAWDAPVPAPLPTFAQTGTPALHPWSGFYLGSEIVAGGGKGVKGGVGGAIDFGYNHEFDNRLVLGIQGSTGYSPFALSGSPWRGFDYAAADVKVGYDMGRLMPFVTTGVVLARPVGPRGPDYVTAADATNDLFNGHGDTKAAARIGAGFDYAVTDKFTVGVSASVGNAAAVLAPGTW